MDNGKKKGKVYCLDKGIIKLENNLKKNCPKVLNYNKWRKAPSNKTTN